MTVSFIVFGSWLFDFHSETMNGTVSDLPPFGAHVGADETLASGRAWSTALISGSTFLVDSGELSV